jgi:uncharacterized protein (DUF2147 family)
MKFSRPFAIGLSSLLIGFLSSTACAATPEDAKGLWLTSEKDGVVEFKPCTDKPSALCGYIVWDKDADTPKGNCGLKVAQLENYAKEGWRDGWVFDPRDNKKYKGVLRVKEGELHLRAFVGSEILGQTEQMTHVDSLPDSPTCKKS